MTLSANWQHARCAFLLFLMLSLTMCQAKVHRGSDAQPPTSPDGDEPKSAFVVARDGVKIHFLTLGRGTPILLIHGYYATAKNNWFENGIAAALAKKNMVIALDNRGHGESDKPHAASDYGERMWQDAVTVLNHLGIKKTHVHGYSMGGSIVTQLLYHHPELFISAVYGGSGIPEVSPQEKAATPADAQGSDPEEVKARALLTGSYPHDLQAMQAVAKNAPWAGPEFQRINLSRIGIPVLALNGEFDSPQAKTHRMKREIKNFESVILRGKSHLTTIAPGYMPALYLQSLLAFIQRHNP